MTRAIIPIPPMGKPRMTQRDKWKKRPCVVRYHAYCDALRPYCGEIVKNCTGVLSWVAYFAMPKSWPKKKQAEMSGKPHTAKPDRDNIDKGIMDALFADDSHIYSGRLEKRWDDGGGERIEIYLELERI